MSRKILIGSAILTVISIIGLIIYVNIGVELPSDTDQVVTVILANDDLPEFFKGKTGFAKNGDVTIWYEVMGDLDPTRETILLVRGSSAPALKWNSNFYQPFIDSGYQVIRYDNRGVGESSWIADWSKDNSYSLEYMAEDGMAVLDAAGVEKAHLIGKSMGGMIAQRMAISHDDRVLSLTSIMSSGYGQDETLPSISIEFKSNAFKLILKYQLINPNEANSMKFAVGISQLMKGDCPYELDTKLIAQKALYSVRKWGRGNPKVVEQHAQAIINSGSRLEELKNLSLPTLVIHGKSDPIVRFEHGQKCAALIPNADTLFIAGMGHDLPQIYMDQFHKAIFKNMNTVNR